MGWDTACIGVVMGLGYVFGHNSSCRNNKPETWVWDACIGVGMGLGYVFESSSNNNKPEMWVWDVILLHWGWHGVGICFVNTCSRNTPTFAMWG